MQKKDSAVTNGIFSILSITKMFISYSPREVPDYASFYSGGSSNWEEKRFFFKWEEKKSKTIPTIRHHNEIIYYIITNLYQHSTLEDNVTITNYPCMLEIS